MYLESACGVWRAGLARLEQVVVTDQVDHRRESRHWHPVRVATGSHSRAWALDRLTSLLPPVTAAHCYTHP